MSQFQTLKSDLTHSRIADTDSVSIHDGEIAVCLLYTSPSPRDATLSRMPSSA